MRLIVAPLGSTRGGRRWCVVAEVEDVVAVPAWAAAGSPRRLSILTTVVRCQLPPRAVAIPLRFNSFASSCWETRPAAISVRMVGTGKHWGSIRHHLASSLRSPKSRARTAGLQDKAHSRRPSDTRNAMTRLAEALSSVRRRNCSKVGASRWGLRAVSTATLALYISSDSRSGSS
jgi:hypothetical protein